MDALVAGLVGCAIGLVIGWSMPEPLVLKSLQEKVWGILHPKS